MAEGVKGSCCGAAGGSNGAPPPVAAWNSMAEWYTAHMSPMTTLVAAQLLKELDLRKGTSTKMRVLETHCGDAVAASELLPLDCISSYTACDFSSSMLALAEKRLQGRATTQVADSTQLPFEDGSFDRYMSNLGCCCASDMDSKLKEARRVLTPGGRAAMSMRIGEIEGDTSFYLTFKALKPFGFPSPPEREGLRIGTDLPALKKKLESCGFQDVKAWRTWVPVPVQSLEDFMTWNTSQPPVQKFLSQLSDEQRAEALKALEAASVKPLSDGALQMAVAVVTGRAAEGISK